MSIRLVPDSLALQPGRAAQALVVLRNVSQAPLRNVRLSWFTNSRLDVEDERGGLPSSGVLLPGAAAVVRLTVVGREQAERLGTVVVRADYTHGSTRTPDVVFAPLTVRPAGFEPPEDILDVQVSSSLTTLTERQPGHMFLLLKNKADVTVTIDSLAVTTPAFLSVDHPRVVTVGPRGVSTVPIVITATDAVRPGKHQVLIDLPLRWTSDRDPARHLVLAREVEVGVLGESAILQVLGVPSFLILPGFLMVMTFGALWKRRVLRPDTASAEFPIDAKDPEFWLLAITLSGVMALMYPSVSGGRDYLEYYGVRDVATVWMFSVFALGLGVYLVAAVLESHRHRQRMPTEQDDGITLLKKLDRQRLGLLMPRVEVGSAKLAAFALQARQEGANTVWVGPAIKWIWKGQARQPDVEARAEIERLIKAGAPGPLARALADGQSRGDLQVYFEEIGSGQIGRPRKVDLKEVAWGGAAPIVEKA
ncbi:MAG: hypothetical protein M3373_03410 [Gemmatimonadota bacterium]|nr:hypothetical protein [Gemmatimonadota bacterium]